MTQGAVGKYGHIVLFTLGYFLLPPAARKYYTWCAASTIMGFFTLGQRTPDPKAVQPEWYEVFYITPWSVLFWGIGIWAFIKMIQTARRSVRAQRILQEVVEIHEEPVQFPKPDEISLPVTVEEVEVKVPRKKQVTVFEYETDSGIVVPSHTRRRVRRGGKTLAGVPIKDRRPVDPRTL